MKHEFSCGAVLYREIDGEIAYVLIADKTKKYGFPKGHRKKRETEVQTALREIKEETGVDARIDEGFRTETRYTIRGQIIKHVTYFVASYETGELHFPADELIDIRSLPFDEAIELLSYPNLKEILANADAYIREKAVAQKVLK